VVAKPDMAPPPVTVFLFAARPVNNQPSSRRAESLSADGLGHPRAHLHVAGTTPPRIRSGNIACYRHYLTPRVERLTVIHPHADAKVPPKRTCQ
jgi:hypothetical protein